MNGVEPIVVPSCDSAKNTVNEIATQGESRKGNSSSKNKISNFINNDNSNDYAAKVK